MADIFNLKINERSRLNLRESLRLKIETKLRQWSVEIELYQKANTRISKIASGAGYQMDEQFQNLLIFRIKKKTN